MDGMDRTARAFLESLFRSAVAAAHPAAVLPTNLPEPPARGRLVILAAGKAAGAMPEVAEQHYLALLPRQRLAGLAVADAVDAEDLVLVLLSGGASANWIAPVDGLTLAEKQAVTRALLKSGAAIGEMNAVRKHLSR